MVGSSAWFNHRGAIILLEQTTSHGTYSWKIFRENITKDPGFSPLFRLSIPIESGSYWYIRRGKLTGLEIRLGGEYGKSVDVNGKHFYLYSKDQEMRQILMQNMEVIGVKIDEALVQNIERGSISVGLSTKFYRWLPHVGWYAEVSGLPERLHTNPEQVLKSTDLILDVLDTLEIKPRKA